MKLKTTHCLVFALFSLLTLNCFAGDYATLNVIGFSKNGRYLAFEEYGSQDGSGFPYSNICFIDTAKNVYAAPCIGVIIEKESATESSARRRSALLARKKLKQLGIVKGNTGKLVVSHQITDLTFEKSENAASVVKFAEEIGSMYRRGDLELVLKETPVKVKDCEVYELETNLLELTLVNNEDDTNKVLQKDAALPASRGCALSYELQDVYLYEGFIATFVRYFTPGFEGPDMRFMAVTGKLK